MERIIRMPRAHRTCTHGVVVSWEVSEGGLLVPEQTLAVLESCKATFDLEPRFRAVVEELLLEPGVEVPVDTPIARLRSLLR